MMRFLPEILLLSLLMAATVHAHTPGKPGGPPRFEDYPIALQAMEEAPAAPAPAPLVFATPEARRFRARLRAAAQQDPNFAGHYVLTTWDCGPQCLVGAAVDVRNGEVTWLPEVTLHASHASDASDAELLQASEPVRFRKNSRLIVFEGARQQNAEDHGVHYYEIRGNELVHVQSIAKQKGNP